MYTAIITLYDGIKNNVVETLKWAGKKTNIYL